MKFLVKVFFLSVIIRRIPHNKKNTSRNTMINIFELDNGEEFEKQPQFSSVPFSDFTPIIIIKIKSKKDRAKADSRINNPTIKKMPRISSIHGRR